jgi:pimeloyl-ACP methyl ester carboxylesterase
MAELRIDDDNSIFYLHTPAARLNAPTFVFVNALTGNTDAWENVVAVALRKLGFGTLSYNFRGQVKSTFSKGMELTPSVIVDDLKLVIAELKPPRPILVGLSIGGLFAAHAVLQGAPAAGLVFMNTLRKINPRIAWINEALPIIAAHGGVQLFMDISFPLIAGPELIKAARPNFLKGDYKPMDPNAPELNLMRNSTAADWDVPYEKLTLPVLSLTGLQDRVNYDADVVEELYARLPNATRETWPEVGHLLPLEAPAKVIDSLGKFGAKIEVSG